MSPYQMHSRKGKKNASHFMAFAPVSRKSSPIHMKVRRKISRLLTQTPGWSGVKRLVLGVSGGMDSAVLLHHLAGFSTKSGIDLIVAHVHHGIRGAEADRDAESAERLAKQHELEFHVAYLGLKKGRSVSEEELRRRRHDRLEAVAERTGAERIALAHTMDDQAETLLLRLMAGTDLPGLGGIRAFRPPFWLHPMLSVSRSEVEEEATRCGITHTEDSSNRDTRYRRNFLRHNVIPLLQAQFNPKLVESLAGLAESADQLGEMVDGLADAWLDAESLGSTWWNASGLNTAPSALRRTAILRAYRKVAGERFSLRRTHLKVLDRLLESKKGLRRVALPGGIVAVRKGNRLGFLRSN